LRRGELYRVRRLADDPKRSRIYVIVSRQAVIDSRYSTVVCAPVYTAREGLASEVNLGPEQGLKHDSAVHCDGLVSLPKSKLTDYIATLPRPLVEELDRALRVALALD
jgi:mRNA interferase MazF